MKTKLLIGLSVFLILFGNLSLWITRNIYDADRFKSNILNTFEKEEVRDAIAIGIVDRILEDNPALRQIASSPAESAISGLLGSPYLQPVVERVAGRFQNYITTGQQEVSIDLTSINALLTRIAQATGNTEQVPVIKNSELVILPADAFPKLNNWLKPITTLGPILAVVGITILGFLLYRADNRLGMLRAIGIYLSIGVLINMLLLPFVSSLISQYSPNPNVATVATETFNTFAASYVGQLSLILLAGLILALSKFFWEKYDNALITRKSRSTEEIVNK